MTLTGHGDGFIYEVDVRGFRQPEISVEIDGNQVVVQGEHFDSNGGDCDLCQNLKFQILRDKFLLFLFVLRQMKRSNGTSRFVQILLIKPFRHRRLCIVFKNYFFCHFLNFKLKRFKIKANSSHSGGADTREHSLPIG